MGTKGRALSKTMCLRTISGFSCWPKSDRHGLVTIHTPTGDPVVVRNSHFMTSDVTALTFRAVHIDFEAFIQNVPTRNRVSINQYKNPFGESK